MATTAPDAGETLGTAILRAATRVALRRGAALTTRDVIDEANVSRQSFYRYFRSKDDLVLAVLTDWVAGHAANLARQAAGEPDPCARLEAHIRATLLPLDTPEGTAAARFVTAEHWRLAQKYPDRIAAVVRPMTDLFHAELVAGRSAGSLAPRDAEADARLMTTTLLGAFHQLAFAADGQAAATNADDVVSYCLAAVT